MCRALQLCERGWMRKGKCRLSVPNRRPSTFDEVVPAFFFPPFTRIGGQIWTKPTMPDG
jgi:hypothetical protein